MLSAAVRPPVPKKGEEMFDISGGSKLMSVSVKLGAGVRAHVPPMTGFN